MTPEAKAKQELHDLIEQLEDEHTGVHYGTPPLSDSKRRKVWVGGHSWDSTVEGHTGQGTTDEEQLRVELFIAVDDASVEDATRRAVDEEALDLVGAVRGLIRGKYSQAESRIKVGNSFAIWKRIVSGASEGPLPIENSGGWQSTHAVDVLFTVRIR